jgi:hypothetical protein
MPKSDSIAIFVQQQNIERYRRLLQIPLDVQRRRAILSLLAQEEAADQEASDAPENGIARFRI